MRKTANWMQQVDERILELLNDEGWSTPWLISNHPRLDRMDASSNRIRERCRVLSQAGYIQPLSRRYKMYEIGVWGRLYLEGDVRADCLVPEPDARRPGHVLG